MNNKLCLVTGANAGIGRATALGLAQKGAHVVMICRSAKRGRAAQQEIIAQSGNQQVDLLLADLSVQAEIRRVAAEFKQRYSRLDVLVNNAGAIFTTRQESADGLELTFALNHLGYFLLTQELLPLLLASAPARIINVASGAHYSGQINFDDLQLRQGYAAFKAYAQSKLANVLFTNELARRLAGTGVTANSLHPGVVGTQFGRNNRGLSLIIRLVRPFLRSEAKGAETSIHLATAPELVTTTGQYFDDNQPKRASDLAYDEALARRLWEESEKLVSRSASQQVS
ncbi:MAG: SDR family oxidoreductase [Chloroflexi bacterium]|nr:SDR family oxidoreductase [Chloroflexota bacterium]